MTAHELLQDLRACGPQSLSVILHFVADHISEARLSTGARLCDATDFSDWLHELGDVARVSGFSESTEVLIPAGRRTRPTVTRQEQSRWDNTCPRCGHVHQGEKECGESIGGGRICRCDLEGVPA
jgi:hypothetical protein